MRPPYAYGSNRGSAPGSRERPAKVVTERRSRPLEDFDLASYLRIEERELEAGGLT